MRNPIFKNTEIQQKFDKQGFVVVPFVNENQVDKLENLFAEMHPELPQSGFFSSSYSTDKQYKTEVSNRIVEILEESYQNNFVDYQPFGASFLFKTPGNNSELAAHQDWTIVDETKHSALNCWIPLTAITKHNGPLMVLPGSHFDNHKTLRAPTIPFFFQNEDSFVTQQLIPVLPKRGEAVILNQSLIHYSPPNQSTSIRKALTAGVKSKGAPMWFHYLNKENGKVERYLMPEDFLISFDNFYEDIFKQPNGKFLEEVSFEINPLPSAEVKKLVEYFKTFGPQKATEKGIYYKILKQFGFAN